MIGKRLPLVTFWITCLLGCAPQERAGAANVPRAQNLDGQIAWGGDLYVRHCRSCHGAAGRDGDAPALTGPDSLPQSPPPASGMRRALFETAEDVAVFATSSMPPGRPRKLTGEEHYAVIAYLLNERGITPRGPLTPQSAARIKLR